MLHNKLKNSKSLLKNHFLDDTRLKTTSNQPPSLNPTLRRNWPGIRHQLPSSQKSHRFLEHQIRLQKTRKLPKHLTTISNNHPRSGHSLHPRETFSQKRLLRQGSSTSDPPWLAWKCSWILRNHPNANHRPERKELRFWSDRPFNSRVRFLKCSDQNRFRTTADRRSAQKPDEAAWFPAVLYTGWRFRCDYIAAYVVSLSKDGPWIPFEYVHRFRREVHFEARHWIDFLSELVG